MGNRDKFGRFIKGNKIESSFRKGATHSEEAKNKISEAGIGRIPSKESIEKRVKTRRLRDNYKISDEMKKHLSDVQKGRHHYPSTEFKKGNIPENKGTRKEYLGNHGYKVNNKGVLDHRAVWCSQKENLSYIPKGMVIHHIDLNKLNNSPNNLVMIPRPDHVRLHSEIRNGRFF